jgi:hypothetical protein
MTNESQREVPHSIDTLTSILARVVRHGTHFSAVPLLLRCHLVSKDFLGRGEQREGLARQWHAQLASVSSYLASFYLYISYEFSRKLNHIDSECDLVM